VTAIKSNTTYHVRAYIKLSETTIYGNEVTFRGLGSGSPQITSIHPEQGNVGDTVKIFGKYFSYFNVTNKVMFGETEVECIADSQDSLIVVVPLNLKARKSPVTVSISNNKSNDDFSFTLNKQTITSISSLNIKKGDHFSVHGRNFVKDSTLVLFNHLDSIYPNVDNDGVFSFEFMGDTRSSKLSLSITIFGDEVVYKDSLINLSPSVFRIEPSIGFVGDTISLVGRNLSGLKSIWISNRLVDPGSVLNTSDSIVQLVVPSFIIGEHPVFNLNVLIGNVIFNIEIKDQFMLRGPKINGLSNVIGVPGSQLSIFGNYFLNSSQVYFGNVMANIITASVDTLVVSVPDFGTLATNIKVESAGQVAWSNESYQLTAAVISNLPSGLIEVGDTLHLFGVFSSELSNTILTVDGNIAPLLDASDSTLTTIIPIPDFNKLSHDVELSIGSSKSTYPNSLQIREPDLVSFSPKSVGKNDTLTLTGYFPYFQGVDGLVTIGSASARTISSSENQLKVTLDVPVDFGLYDVGYLTGSKPYLFVGQIAVPWRLFNANSNGLSYDYSFQANGMIYGYSSTLINSYDPIFDQSTFITNIPDTIPGNIAFKPFVIGNKVYIGFQHEQVPTIRIYEYDLSSDTWTEINPLPVTFYNGFSFVINNIGYVGMGYIPNSRDISPTIWAYDPSLGDWVQKNDFPATPRAESKGITYNGKGYVFGGLPSNGAINELTDAWSYSDLTDSWTLINSPGSCSTGVIPFINNGDLYIGGPSCSYKYWKYNNLTFLWDDIASPSITKDPNLPIVIFGSIYTVSNNTFAFYSKLNYPPTNSTSFTWVLDPSIIPK